MPELTVRDEILADALTVRQDRDRWKRLASDLLADRDDAADLDPWMWRIWRDHANHLADRLAIADRALRMITARQNGAKAAVDEWKRQERHDWPVEKT